MLAYFLGAVIALPILLAALFLLVPNGLLRKVAVFFMAAVLFAAVGWAVLQGSAVYRPASGMLDLFEKLFLAGDILLVAVLLFIGRRIKSPAVVGLVVVQALLYGWFEWKIGAVKVADAFVIDHLTLIMLLLIDVIGPLIAIFALRYMDIHERRLHLEKSRQPRFFATIALFLGAMNGLVLVNHLMWVFFFWEVTTLCCFLLIAHDGTEEATANAKHALILNSVGGVGFIAGILVVFNQAQTLAVTELLLFKDAAVLLAPLAFLLFAGFTKSAQVPFQSWLLGAMVAPNPVSALLHASTMVNAGVYLILRFSPVFMNSWPTKVVAVIGAFSFAVTALLAISQTDAKRILAYSTISNLGLIIALSCFATLHAIYAAALLIVLHGVSKALLFLCVGTIEQEIGSRDIEDMDGIRTIMPLTASLAALGAISMLLPPFGVLITKWIAIESSARHPIAMFFIILGSAFTVMFWGKFIGKILSTHNAKKKTEQFDAVTHLPLIVLGVGVVFLSVLLVPFTNYFAAPYLKSNYARFADIAQADPATFLIQDFSGFSPYLFFGVLLASMVFGRLIYLSVKPRRYVKPYLAGENSDDSGSFHSLADGIYASGFKNFCLYEFLNERKVTAVSNLAAVALIILMFEVIIR